MTPADIFRTQPASTDPKPRPSPWWFVALVGILITGVTIGVAIVSWSR